jgi:hypothetical protein
MVFEEKSGINMKNEYAEKAKKAQPVQIGKENFFLFLDGFRHAWVIGLRFNGNWLKRHPA